MTVNVPAVIVKVCPGCWTGPATVTGMDTTDPVAGDATGATTSGATSTGATATGTADAATSADTGPSGAEPGSPVIVPEATVAGDWGVLAAIAALILALLAWRRRGAGKSRPVRAT